MRTVSTAALSFTLACGAVERDDPARLERGLSLFQDECARCHGPEGLGDGPQSAFLYPKPRNFARGNFRIAANDGNFPTDSDLMRVIRDGMPGSAMPPFPRLADSDLKAVAAAVKHLAVEGKIEELLATAQQEGRSMTRAEASALTAERFAPGAPIELPPEAARSEADLARGKELFEEMCSACHAPDSHAVKRDMTDDTGAFLYPRDLNHALLLRSSSARDLALTVTRGLPGTPMPAYELSSDELWPLVRYVESLTARPDVPTTSSSSGVRTITLTGVADPGVWTEDEIDLGYRPPAAVAPARVILREGEEVVLVVKSADVTHRLYSPALGLGPIEVYPGHPRTIRFQAPAPGEYEYFCTSLCGHCHYSMKGSILVLRAGEEAPSESETRTHECENLRAAQTSVSVPERGEALYRRMQCGECHGDAGRGGVENLNALPSERVPALDRMAESLLYWDRRDEDLATVVDSLGKGAELHSMARNPPFTDYDRFLRQYDRYRQVMLEGRFTPPRDPAGPEPPLQMPAFQARLEPEEIDALLAYLLSLSPGFAADPVEQPIAFNHALHVADAGLACRDCHAGDGRGAAGLPAIVVCQDCHGPDDLDDSASAGLVKLVRNIESGEEVGWVQVNRLPEHVRFSHLPHVDSAGLSCEQCHGDMKALRRPPGAPFFRLRMSFCVDCHTQRSAPVECRTCHF